MQLNDAVPERRNLIVFCVTTIIFYIGGGNACSGIKLPIVGVELNNITGLISIYWAIFVYLLFRYFLIYRTAEFKADSSSNYENNKSFKAALKHVFKKYVKAEKLVGKLKFGIGQNTNRADLVSKLKEAGIDETKELPSGAYSYLVNSKSNTLDVGLTLQVNNSGNGPNFRSEEIEPASFKFLYLTITRLTPHLLTDKYLSDWVVPWVLALFSIILHLGFWVFGNYQIC